MSLVEAWIEANTLVASETWTLRHIKLWRPATDSIGCEVVTSLSDFRVHHRAEYQCPVMRHTVAMKNQIIVNASN